GIEVDVEQRGDTRLDVPAIDGTLEHELELARRRIERDAHRSFIEITAILFVFDRFEARDGSIRQIREQLIPGKGRADAKRRAHGYGSMRSGEWLVMPPISTRRIASSTDSVVSCSSAFGR